MSSTKYQEYVQHLQDLTAQRPEYGDAWNDLGLVMSFTGRERQALAAFDRALAINPFYAEARVSRSFSLADAENVGEGLRAFRTLLTGSPDDFHLIFALGVFCMRHDWKETGLAQLNRAAKMRPNVPFALAHAAAAALELGDNRAAGRFLEKTRKALEDLRLPWFVSSPRAEPLDLDSYGQWDNPYLVRVHARFAKFLCAQGRAEEAAAEYLHANSRLPGHAWSMVEMGRFLLAAERPQEAAEWLSAAIRVEESCDPAHFELSFLHAQKDEPRLAVEALRAAVALRPLFPDYRYQLGTLLADLGRGDEALEEFRRALILNPFYGQAALQLANAYLEKRAPEDALGALAGSRDFDWPEALVLSARAHLMSGRQLDAKKELERALVIDGSDSEARELIERISGSP